MVETVKEYHFVINGSSQPAHVLMGTPDNLQMDVSDNDGNIFFCILRGLALLCCRLCSFRFT